MRLLREAFTPYEIARGGLLISWFCIGTGFIGAMVLDRPGGVVLLFVPGVLAGVIGWYAARCPGCGKSPMAWYVSDWGERRGGQPMGRRFWPERTCSRCRTALDVH